jgi:hypothetical protein
MNISHYCLSGFLIVTTAALSGCNYCGADEQHAVNLGAGLEGLTVVRDGVTRKIDVVSRLTSPPAEGSKFDFVFNTIEGSSTGEGIALTISGPDPVTDETIALTLALPVSLRQGDQYSIGATFTIDVSLDGDPRSYGPHDLQQSNQAEAAFTVAKYTFPPPTFTVNFRAVTSTGTVRVTDRDDGQVELSLNLSFVDVNGKTSLVTGSVQVSTEKYTPPCLS